MTSYVKSTNFASKDSLASGNPLKIIKGTEFDIEFNNIATAINTKADTADPTFTGVPLAPTASVGTSNTQISTTAFVTAAIAAAKEALYPVGSIYINAGASTNPATLLGFGTWVAFGAGRVMVGLNGSDSLFDTLEETGGSKDAIVVSHTHTTTDTRLSSVTTFDRGGGGFGTTTVPVSGTSSPRILTSGGGSDIYQVSAAFTNSQASLTSGSAGSSGTNANLQPYVTVAMWKRTA